MEQLNGPAMIRGQVRAYRVTDSVWASMTSWMPNQVMYDWASIVSRVLADGSANYRINGMYLEYANLADPEDEVAVPAFDRSDGIAYYDGLSSSPDIDYLRVPLTAAVRTSSNSALFPDGNLVRFFAQSQGVVGTHGKPFSATDNSKVYGGALVAIPDQNDRTQDLVFARFYTTPELQQIKLDSSQIGLSWSLTLQ